MRSSIYRARWLAIMVSVVALTTQAVASESYFYRARGLGASGNAADTHLALAASALPSATTGSAWAHDFSKLLSGDGAGGKVTWSAAGMPPWLAVNAATGVASGTPSAAESVEFVIKAANGTSTVERSYSLAVGAMQVQASRLSAGSGQTCAMLPGGMAKCWGWDVAGQLGIGGSANISQPGPSVIGVSDAKQVVSNGLSACALLLNGTVKCWGGNSNGQLGNGTVGSTSDKAQDPVIGLTGATSLAVGSDHACAIVANGEVKCWGLNDRGQLGIASTASNTKPGISAIGISRAVAISAGSKHTCAVLGGGTVKCWGLNDKGQLGVGNTANLNAPGDPAVGISDAVSVSTASNATCALSSGGSVRCWGENSYGQVGDGTQVNALVPQAAVPNLVGVTAIGTGNRHACALVTGGAVKCWGYNAFGQAGVGAATGIEQPGTSVVGISGATDIALGSNHSCAALGDGTVQCWGYNAYGQLGVGNTTSLPKPGAKVIGLNVSN